MKDIKTNFLNEVWKKVDLKITEEVTSNLRIEISNFGEVKSFNKLYPNGRLLKGSSIQGYPILKLRFFRKNIHLSTEKLDQLQKSISHATKLIEEKNNEIELKKKRNQLSIFLEKEVEKLQKNKISFQKEIEKVHKKYKIERNIYYSVLIHKLVATYFLEKPQAEQTIVAHLDYNKTNNHFKNLKWMSKAENMEHQRNSPAVKKYKALKKFSKTEPTNNKLRVIDVMLIKKKLAENKLTIKNIAKQFNVSDTQIIRIRKGENWKEVESA